MWIREGALSAGEFRAAVVMAAAVLVVLMLASAGSALLVAQLASGYVANVVSGTLLAVTAAGALAVDIALAVVVARTAVSVYDWMLALSLRSQVQSGAPRGPDDRPRKRGPLLAIVAGTDRRAA